MVVTRAEKLEMAAEQITKIIDEKFEIFKNSVLNELKTTLLGELKRDIDQLLLEEKTKFTEHVTSKLANNIELVGSVEIIKQHVKHLQTENARLNELHKAIRLDLDDLEQYGRRPNLRLYGIPVEAKETDVMVEAKVRSILDDLVVNSTIEKLEFDRAHRIGKPIVDNHGVKKQAVIERFPTFRDRTLVYRARKTVNVRKKVGVSLDLTQRRLKLLKEAKTMVENVDNIQFVYTDVNCNTRVFTRDGEHLLFHSVCSLQNIIANA